MWHNFGGPSEFRGGVWTPQTPPPYATAVNATCQNLRLRIGFLQYRLYRHLEGATGLTGSDDRPGWSPEQQAAQQPGIVFRCFWGFCWTWLRDYTCMFMYISCGAAAPRGPWPPHSLGFQIAPNDPPKSVGLLWTSDQLVAETSTWQCTTLTTDIHSTGEIRTHNLIRRAAAHLRQSKKFTYPLNRRSGGPQSGFEGFGDKKIFFLLRGKEPQFPFLFIPCLIHCTDKQSGTDIED